MKYSPPTPADLIAFRDQLAYTQNKMAELAGVAGNSQWRKYTGGAKPRKMSQQMLFFMCAQLELDDDQLDQVFKRMVEVGAVLKNN